MKKFFVSCVLVVFLCMFGCFAPDSNSTKKEEPIPSRPIIYYDSIDELDGTAWQTKDKTVTVIFVSKKTVQVVYNNQNYNLNYMSCDDGIFIFESEVIETNGNYWDVRLVFTPYSKIDSFYQFYSDKDINKSGQLEKKDQAFYLRLTKGKTYENES